MKAQFKKIHIPLTAERIAIDELFSDGSVRILRARRNKNVAPEDMSINRWNTEREDFIDQWKVEAFVGFPTARKLREGDVFFIRNGTQLNSDYKGKKILERDTAKEKHLIIPWDSSISLARKEIKEEFYKLTASQIAKNEKDASRLAELIKENLR